MKKNIIYSLFFLLVLFIFRAWFLLNSLSSGDWSYNFPQTLKSFSSVPYAWSWAGFATGLGGNITFFLGLSSFFSGSSNILFNIFKLPWVLIERLVWFWPFLIISVSSSYYLFKKLFSDKFALLSSFIYLFNTYILMLVGGGQMGIAIAYALAPLVVYLFIKTIDSLNSSENNFQFSIFNFQLPLLAGFVLAILVMFDLRVAYITLAAVATYAVLGIMNYVFNKEKTGDKILSTLYLILYTFLVPGIITFLLNSFWIIPLISGGKNPLTELGDAYTSLESVKFFSFAKFEDAISLLHPNWPENIFGKVGFLKPEFLLLPVLAFASLLFVPKIKDQKTKIFILYFALLGLVGAFLAKGANEPFGGIYLWLFDHFPGFIMFRDPTKWYTLVAISYSILIPFSAWNIYGFIKSKIKNQKSKIYNAQNLFLLFIVFCLLYLIRPALFGQLTGTFRTTSVPSDYIKLEQFLSSQNNFSRTLWIPTQQRFGFYTNTHPAIPAREFFKSTNNNQIINQLRKDELLLQEAGVKYVIVPFDSQGEIYLKDRKYNEKLYLQTVKDISSIKWLKKIAGFGKIAVFEAPEPRDHFYFSSQQSAVSNQQITYQYISPVEYIVSIENAKKGDIVVFSESYDARWIARDVSDNFYDWPNLISSNPYNRIFNSFTLRKNGNYALDIYYYPQILVNIGMVISGLTLLSILGALIYLRKKKL